MTKRMLIKAKIVFEWIFWILSKYFQKKENCMTSIVFEMASRMLGLSHFFLTHRKKIKINLINVFFLLISTKEQAGTKGVAHDFSIKAHSDYSLHNPSAPFLCLRCALTATARKRDGLCYDADKLAHRGKIVLSF